MSHVLNRLLLTLLGCFLAHPAHTEIFKYQDAQGKWHFTDKKPASTHSTNLETLHFDKTKQRHARPYLEVKAGTTAYEYWAHNPLYAPIEVFFRFDNKPEEGFRVVLEALGSKLLAHSPLTEPKRYFHFHSVTGDPNAQPQISTILPPFTDFKPMQITQAFHGRFSHSREPSLYAVDISMPVGTQITAVLPGIVISTKDDYHTSGVTSGFFYDKANYVEILHEDGSYAIYGHLLLGGIKVTPGQQVKAGELIALSGNTGFSTGPHLHFAVHHNAQGKAKSLPFTFLQTNNQTLTPEAGVWLMPYSAK